MSPRWRTYVDLLEAAVADGLPLHGQILPRPAGAMFGPDLTFHPFVLNPSYRPIADLPLPEKVRAMRDPELRRRIISEARSEEHTSELQSLMRISYAVFCLKKNINR